MGSTAMTATSAAAATEKVAQAWADMLAEKLDNRAGRAKLTILAQKFNLPGNARWASHSMRSSSIARKKSMALRNRCLSRSKGKFWRARAQHR